MNATPVAERLAHVAEHHLDDVHRGAEVVRDLVRAAVHLRARRVPRLEHGLDRPGELLARVLGERPAGRVLVDRLEPPDELDEVVGGQLDVLLDPALALQRGELRLEAVAVDAVDRVAVHLDQPPVRVVGEAAVARPLGQALDRLVVEPDVEDRVHHPRHRDRRPGADRDEQRVAAVAEALPGVLLQRAHVRLDLLEQAGRHPPALAHVRAAGLGRDREPRRHGHTELRHLREPDPLAAEQLPPALAGLVEVVDVSHGSNLPMPWDWDDGCSGHGATSG